MTIFGLICGIFSLTMFGYVIFTQGYATAIEAVWIAIAGIATGINFTLWVY